MTETTATPSTESLTAAAYARSAASTIRTATRNEIEHRRDERGLVAAAMLAARIARGAEQRESGAVEPFDRAIEGLRARAARRWLRVNGRELTRAIDADDQTVDLILALTGANT